MSVSWKSLGKTNWANKNNIGASPLNPSWRALFTTWAAAAVNVYVISMTTDDVTVRVVHITDAGRRVVSFAPSATLWNTMTSLSQDVMHMLTKLMLHAYARVILTTLMVQIEMKRERERLSQWQRDHLFIADAEVVRVVLNTAVCKPNTQQQRLSQLTKTVNSSHQQE